VLVQVLVLVLVLVEQQGQTRRCSRCSIALVNRRRKP